MSYKRWICIAVFLFGIGLAFGLTVPPGIPGIPGIIAKDITALEELVGLLASLPLPLVAVLLFIKNVSVMVIGFALSPILCLAPALALVVNGWVLGLVSVIVSQEKSLGYVLAGLLPHGIFELPALILAQAAALSFGTMAILALFKRERRNLLLPNLEQNLRYLVVALVLLVPAAIIETYVTPLFLT